MRRNKIFTPAEGLVVVPAETAHHEAGHVAMAIELGISIEWTGIERTDMSYGCTMPGGDTMPLFEGLLFSMSGPAAGHLYHGKKGLPIQVSQSDGEVIEAHMSADEFEVVILHVLRFLSSAPGVWHGVEALANAMLEKQRLTGAECVTIYRDALDQCHDEFDNCEIDPKDPYYQFYRLVRPVRQGAAI